MEKLKIACVFLHLIVTLTLALEQNGAVYREEITNATVINKTEFHTDTVNHKLHCLIRPYSFCFIVEVTETVPDKEYQCRFYVGKFVSVETAPGLATIYESYAACSTHLCQDLQGPTHDTDGVYTIQLGGSPIKVWCDMTQNDGGWTTIQRRIDGSVDFQRLWQDYKVGFGEASGNYWLGNDHLHHITDHYQNVLVRIKVLAPDGDRAEIISENFFVADAANWYRVRTGTFVSGHSGLKNDWNYHNNVGFTTTDVDNDNSNENCAERNRGGFWYTGCVRFNANGIYGRNDNKGIISRSFKALVSMKEVSIAVKRKD
ncbi:ficolin-1-like [Clytia hemisphaerica]